ncbi:hypothetical protein B0O99DRAFT_515010 [Bisporella sp. PMI_857]|nr:hypothetical protein B0O99DRAFT_515010 [Bisporella sp. PMI_857]
MAVSLFAPNHAHKHVIMLDKKFNAFNIERKAGIKIIWTNNLEDHLCLKDEDTRLAIFHHASISGMACSNRQTAVYENDLLQETLKTLRFLFPEEHKLSKKWFKKVQKDQSLDSAAAKCGQLSLEDRNGTSFTYWHERLSILQFAFGERVKEKEAKQWWYDRRWSLRVGLPHRQCQALSRQ